MSAQASLVGIYKITSPNGSIYIGQTRNFSNRINAYKRLSIKNQKHIYNSIKKYGWENHRFDVILNVQHDIPAIKLLELERSFYLYYKGIGAKLMNCRLPGANYGHSEKTKEKIGLANLGKLNGIILSDERRKKISLALIGNKRRLGHKLTDQHKKIISESNKGRKRTVESLKKSSESKMGEKNPMYGKKLTEKHRKKISESNKARVITNEMRLKMSIGGKMKRRPILQVDVFGNNIRLYSSATEAKSLNGYCRQSIQKCAAGKTKTAYNYTWKYV